MSIPILQINQGTFNGSSDTISLPEATEDGNQIVVFVGRIGDNTNFRTAPTITGFVPLGGLNSSDRDYAHTNSIVKASTSGGENSWTLTLPDGETARVLWIAMECVGVDLDWPFVSYLGGATSNQNAADVSSLTVAHATASETFDGVNLVAFMATELGGSTPTISGYTDGWEQIAATSGSDGSGRAAAFTLARKPLTKVETPSCSASVSPSARGYAWMITLTGVNSRHAPNLIAMSGAEHGSATTMAQTGLDTGTGSRPIWNTVTGSPAVVNTGARSGTYCYELNSTSAAENMAWTYGTGTGTNNLAGAGSNACWSYALHVKFPSTLPSISVPFYTVEAGSSANSVVLRFDPSTGKIGCKIGASGTEVFSDAAITGGQWIGINGLYDPRSSDHSHRWTVDYNSAVGDTTPAVLQSTATATGMTAAAVSTVRHGWTTAITAQMWIDDTCGSVFRKTFPLGDIEMIWRGPDPAGTPTCSVPADFQVFTANGGTRSAWTAAGCRNALDEVPFVIGASADGVCQITNGTNFFAVPIQGYTLAPSYAAVAARWIWAGWAASGNPATFLFKPVDSNGAFGPSSGYGNATDAGFDDTSMWWMGMMHNPNLTFWYQLTQAIVNAFAAQFGFGPDMNPDAGTVGVGLELAIQKASTFGIINVADAETGEQWDAYIRQDPTTGAAVSYLITASAGSTHGVTFEYDIEGTPQTPVHVNANSTGEVNVSAEYDGKVTATRLVPDLT